MLHIFAGMDGETFEVTTNKGKNAYLKLAPTEHPVANFDPRPSYSRGWDKVDGVWQHTAYR
jgi:hypothetical protein